MNSENATSEALNGQNGNTNTNTNTRSPTSSPTRTSYTFPHEVPAGVASQLPPSMPGKLLLLYRCLLLSIAMFTFTRFEPYAHKFSPHTQGRHGTKCNFGAFLRWAPMGRCAISLMITLRDPITPSSRRRRHSNLFHTFNSIPW